MITTWLSRTKSMPSPGVSVAASTMFARSCWPEARSPSTTCACVTPAGSCSEM